MESEIENRWRQCDYTYGSYKEWTLKYRPTLPEEKRFKLHWPGGELFPDIDGIAIFRLLIDQIDVERTA